MSCFTQSVKNPCWHEADSCLFCQSRQLKVWKRGLKDHLGHVKGSWRLMLCRSCNSVTISPMPATENVAALYPELYSFRPDLIRERSGSRLAPQAEALFSRLINAGEVNRVRKGTGISSGSMLDIGCGTGERMARFAQAGFHVRGLEIQPQLVEHVRKTYRLKADLSSFEQLPYRRESFDLITIYYVMEHLRDPPGMMSKIYSIIKPGGWLAAEMPLADSLQGRLLGRRWSQYAEAPRHLAIPSQSGIIQLLQTAGFRRVRVKPSGSLNSAAAFGISVVPSAILGNAYRAGCGPFRRFLGGAAGMAAFPAAALESHWLGKPAFGLVLAQKPAI